jgi:hypothetical protein
MRLSPTERIWLKTHFTFFRSLSAEVRCKPGWTFELLDEDGALRLVIVVPGVDSFNPQRKFAVTALSSGSDDNLQ